MNEQASTLERSAKSHRVSWLLFGLLALLAIAIVLVVGTLLFGLHTGEEFAPATFSRRTFYYYQVPLLGIQVSPIVRETESNVFANYLLSNQFVKPIEEEEPRWDLVYAARSGQAYFRGDADILCSYLDARNEHGTPFWKVWSEDNRRAAKVLWPLVADLARRQLYILIPELIELAQTETDPQRLQRELNLSLARQYGRLGRAQRELGNNTIAADLFGEALRYAPDDQELQRAREACRRAAGHQETE